MSKNMNKVIGVFIVFLLLLAACSGDRGMDKYTRLAKKELASNKRVDSIFWGFHFGMTEKDFYMYCWDMNQKGKFTDGNDSRGNMTVLYKLDKELKHPASMNFYPDFHDGVIWRMRANFHYDGWSPWTKYLSADSLLPDVLAMCKRWHNNGNSFIQINDKTRGILYVKVDGNRRIVIGKYNDVIVKVEYTDMLVEKKIKDNNEK